MYVGVIFLNLSRTDCTLVGYPAITLLNAEGRTMMHERKRNSPWVPSRRVVVSRGGTAGFVIQFSDGAVSGVDPRQGCRAATVLEVQLRDVLQYGQPYTTYFSMPLAPCDGGGFEVTAIQRGDPLP